MKWIWWALGGTAAIVILNRFRVMDDLNKTRLSENFNLGEFVVTSTGLDNIPGEEERNYLRALVQNVLQPLRSYLGKPIRITSGYRSPLVNSAIGGSQTSQHVLGQAADFHVDGMSNQQLIDTIRNLRLPYDQLIDENLKGRQWVHVSHVPGGGRRQWMTARDGAGGKTVYTTVKIG